MKSSNKKTSHEKVTDQLIELLETGTIPWRKTWKVSGGIPRNMVSGKQYRGMNILILSAKGYANPNWVSFKQAKELAVEKARKDGLEIVEVKKGKKSIYYLNGELFRGGVRKGEKSTLITFWKLRFVDENNKTVKTKEESAETRFRLMTHNVFNVSQCTGFIVGEEVSNQNDPIESAIEIAENYQDGPEVKHGFDHAAYTPAEDVVSMPNQERFTSSEEYYGTLFHELVHSTGHKSRLNRDALQGTINFGSDSYGKEELVAELGASMLGGHAGISDTTIENSAAYCRSWIATLKGDSTLAVSAASAAQRAADRILGVTWD